MTLKISPEQMAIYKQTARERQARDEQALRERRQAAMLVAHQAAQLLKERYGATRVLLFGSLAHGAWFHERSDIDLAVIGIRTGEFFGAWANLDHLDHQFEIDLIDYEDALIPLREVIDKQGIEL